MGVKLLDNYFERIALGEESGKIFIYKFGRNSAVGATEVLISSGGVYGLPPTAQQVSVVSDDVINDNPTGNGARTVHIFGLDSDYNQINELIPLAGTSNLSFIRVFRAFVETAGTLTPINGGNQGTISINQITSAIPMLLITPNDSQTLTSCYTIPEGYTGLMWSADTTTGEGKNATSRLKSRKINTDQPFRTKGIRDNFENTAGQQFIIPSVYEARSDIVFTSISTAAGTSVSGTFLLELVKDDR